MRILIGEHELLSEKSILQFHNITMQFSRPQLIKKNPSNQQGWMT